MLQHRCTYGRAALHIIKLEQKIFERREEIHYVGNKYVPIKNMK